MDNALFLPSSLPPTPPFVLTSERQWNIALCHPTAKLLSLPMPQSPHLFNQASYGMYFKVKINNNNSANTEYVLHAVLSPSRTLSVGTMTVSPFIMSWGGGRSSHSRPC